MSRTHGHLHADTCSSSSSSSVCGYENEPRASLFAAWSVVLQVNAVELVLAEWQEQCRGKQLSYQIDVEHVIELLGVSAAVAGVKLVGKCVLQLRHSRQICV
jgi:hypothetical protein